MSDHYKGFQVTLEDNMHQDDAEAVQNALRQVRGVVDVKPIIGDWEDSIIRSRTVIELWKQVTDVFQKANRP